ncbi:sialate O-acetylesterase [Alteromonas sp. H39]|uniref:sialate O-acetylesterase n=1 Tax=Alteromonas sp. H39 TaxID=3389876 RepID=UPI0039E092F7
MRLVTTTFLSLFSFTTLADTHFHPLFSDNAVLQRGTDVPVVVFSDNTQELTLHLDGKAIGKAAVNNGRWAVPLPPQKAGGPHKITVEGNDVTLSIDNVFFGDVYLTSGQSNMELPLARTEEAYPQDVALADYAQIREYTVPDAFDFNQPQPVPGKSQWKTAQNENIRSLSAVAFYFARHLHRYEGVPIGIVNASLGGSPIEAWMAPRLLADYPEALEAAEPFKDDAFIEQTQREDQAAANDWHTTLTSRDAGLNATSPWYTENVNTSDWQSFTVPGRPDFANGGFTGSWWAKKTVTLAQTPETPWVLRLGRIRDADEVWVNGTRVGNTTYHYPPRRYTVPQGILHKGDNVITVRVISNNGDTEFFPDKAFFLGSDTQRISLAGEWQYKQAATMQDPAPTQTFIRWKPTGLYHAMIAPLTDFPLSGVLWYQGESNTGQPATYAEKMLAMMNDWRQAWQQPALPFFTVQLANYMAPQTAPEQSHWAELRDEQAQAATTPNAYMVTIIDAGEYNDIHPVNKRVVGERLAKQAQHAIYQRDTNISGPQVQSATVDGSAVVLTITDPQGLRTLTSPQSGFTLAGEDGAYHFADVTRKGNQFRLTSDKVAKPVSVRYAWANNPFYSITDTDGWPMAPFEHSLK